MVRTATATRFIRGMSTGRTQPILLGCQLEDGADVEVVVKLRGVHMQANAQVAELVSAALARTLGLHVPDPFLVHVDPALASVVPEPHRSAMLASSGWNFGSLHL